MSSATLPTAFNKAGFQSWLTQLSEPDWLLELRRGAWEQFENSKWPDRSQEEWMRSDLRPFKLDRYSLAASSASSTVEAGVGGASRWLSDGVDLAGQIETTDGQTIRSHLAEDEAARGVVFGDLSQMANEHESLVRPNLFSVVEPHQDRFASLHTAAWSGGQLVYIPRGVCVTRPCTSATACRMAAAISDIP